MKVSIDVTSRAEGDALKAALEDPATRAITVITGELARLPSTRVRERVLRWLVEAWTDTGEASRRTQVPLFRLHDADGTSGE
jgi:hypothetical protein